VELVEAPWTAIIFFDLIHAHRSHDNAVFDLDAAYLKRRKKLILHEISFKFFAFIIPVYRILEINNFIKVSQTA